MPSAFSQSPPHPTISWQESLVPKAECHHEHISGFSYTGLRRKLAVPFTPLSPSLLRFLSQDSVLQVPGLLSLGPGIADPQRQSWGLARMCSSDSLQWAAGKMKATLAPVPTSSF